MALLDALLGIGLGLCSVTSSPEFSPEGNAIRVRDVVTLGCLNEADRARAGAHVLINRGSRDSITLSRASLGRLARRRVPMLELDDDLNGDVRLRFRPQETPQRECARARHAIPTGAAIDTGAIERAPCLDAPFQPRARYDRASGVTRALVDIAAGEPLGELYVPSTRMTNAGDRLNLVIAVGPIVIERPVEVLQSSRPGERVFVRDAEGHILAVQVGEIAQ